MLRYTRKPAIYTMPDQPFTRDAPGCFSRLLQVKGSAPTTVTATTIFKNYEILILHSLYWAQTLSLSEFENLLWSYAEHIFFENCNIIWVFVNNFYIFGTSVQQGWIWKKVKYGTLPWNALNKLLKKKTTSLSLIVDPNTNDQGSAWITT